MPDSSNNSESSRYEELPLDELEFSFDDGSSSSPSSADFNRRSSSRKVTTGSHPDAEESDARESGSDDSKAMEYSLAPGTIVDNEIEVPDVIGEYRIGSMIGRGGMGHVYDAEHVRMGRRVAIKILSPHLLRDQRSIERFYEEVRAAAKLMHPNIVTALDAGQVGDLHFLVMEFVDGVTFKSW